MLACGAAAAFVARWRGPAVGARLMAVSRGFARALDGILSKLMADALASARWALLGGRSRPRWAWAGPAPAEPAGSPRG